MLCYQDMPVLASAAAVRQCDGVTIDIGPPQVVASRDQSPDEGTFLAPKLCRLGQSVYLNWSFDWDVCDPKIAHQPNGRVSDDQGITWHKQTTLMPQGHKYQTSPNEASAWFPHGFEIPGQPGTYKVPTWHTHDAGKTWQSQSFTTLDIPGTKGVDIYNPPAAYRRHDHNYLRGGVQPELPTYLQNYCQEVSPLRPLVGGILKPQATDANGVHYSVTYGRYLKDTANIHDWESQYWEKLNWQRYAVFLHESVDGGKTWQFVGVPVDGSDYDTGHQPRHGFTEPALVIFPDGDMLCALRTNGNMPLYCVRSFDRGRTWTPAHLLSPEYVFPICGVNPQLVLLDNGILALATGRPNCTIHFSKDRGHTWFHSETLFEVTGNRWEAIYSGSHTNVSMIGLDDNTLLYTHDATRLDTQATHPWLRNAGHGLVITRRIKVNTP